MSEYGNLHKKVLCISLSARVCGTVAERIIIIIIIITTTMFMVLSS